jgi:Fic family protein
MSLSELISEINILNAELSGMKISIEQEQRLWKKIRLEWNYHSNHLEGNTLTYSETQLLLIFDKTTGDHDFRDLEEMRNHDVALKLVVDEAKDLERPLTESFIRKLNEIILVRPFWKEAITPDKQKTQKLIQIGVYKTSPNSVLLPSGETFEYASPEETPVLMNELIEWYRKESENPETHPLFLAALFHYRFIRIHPFDDGNGRIARLIMNYVLMRKGFPPVIIRSEDKANYLFALRKADSGDLEAFVQYVGEQLIRALQLSIKAAKGESIDELGDIDKELALLKAKMNLIEDNKIKKNQENIKNIYYNSLRSLFFNVENQCKKFMNLFKGNSFFYDIPNSYHESLEELESEMESKFKEKGDIIDSFKLYYSATQFRNDKPNDLSINIEIEANFTNSDYIIYLKAFSKIFFEKRLEYKHLSKKEIEQVTMLVGKELLRQINGE